MGDFAFADRAVEKLGGQDVRQPEKPITVIRLGDVNAQVVGGVEHGRLKHDGAHGGGCLL